MASASAIAWPASGARAACSRRWRLSLSYMVGGRPTAYGRTGVAGCGFIYHFCPVCGTTLFHTEDDVHDEVFAVVGGFADPGFPPPKISVYDCRRHPWVQLPPGTRAFERDPV